MGATVAVIPVLVIFGIVIGGIYAGVYNPTPAAAIGVFLVGLYGIARRRLDPDRLRRRAARDRAHQAA